MTPASAIAAGSVTYSTPTEPSAFEAAAWAFSWSWWAALASRAQHRERDRFRPRRIAGVPAVARRSDIALGQLHDLHLAAAALLLFFLAEYLSEKSHFYILSLKGLLSLFCPHDITA